MLVCPALVIFDRDERAKSELPLHNLYGGIFAVLVFADGPVVGANLCDYCYYAFQRSRLAD